MVPPDIVKFISKNYSNSRGSKNLHFYQNQGKASNLKIEELQEFLKYNYDELESSHYFIQWFFPLREGNGMNSQAQKLGQHEIDGITSDPKAMKRLLESYEVLMDFYGFDLISTTTGQIGRSTTLLPSPGAWNLRYQNFSTSSHNYLRITRIIKSLDHFGLSKYGLGLLGFILVEQSRGELIGTSLINSMKNYWIHCIRDEEEKKFLVEKMEVVRKGGTFSEVEYIEMLEKRES